MKIHVPLGEDARIQVPPGCPLFVRHILHSVDSAIVLGGNSIRASLPVQRIDMRLSLLSATDVLQDEEPTFAVYLGERAIRASQLPVEGGGNLREYVYRMSLCGICDRVFGSESSSTVSLKAVNNSQLPLQLVLVLEYDIVFDNKQDHNGSPNRSDQ
jgi:hypothetical protein